MTKKHCDSCDKVLSEKQLPIDGGVIGGVNGTKITRRVTLKTGLNLEVWLEVAPRGKDDLCRECYDEAVNLYVELMK